MHGSDSHAISLGTSAILSSQQVEDAISPYDVIGLLNQAKISFVLAGAYGLSGWLGKPRATQDVDVIVAVRHLKKATRVLLDAFPDLEADDQSVVIRLKQRESQEVVIDLMKPNQSLYREAFKHTRTVEAKGHRYRIPSLEMALAMKFAAMLSPNRQEGDRYLDAHDFIHMVKRNQDIDVNMLLELGELVYNGGGANLVEKVRVVRAGEKLVL